MRRRRYGDQPRPTGPFDPYGNSGKEIPPEGTPPAAPESPQPEPVESKQTVIPSPDVHTTPPHVAPAPVAPPPVSPPAPAFVEVGTITIGAPPASPTTPPPVVPPVVTPPVVVTPVAVTPIAPPPVAPPPVVPVIAAESPFHDLPPVQAASPAHKEADMPYSGPALSLTLRVGNKYAYHAERTRQHVYTQITAHGTSGGIGTGQRMPVNIALVVDRSGSMEGEPLEYVKRACNLVVDMLTPQDVLSIVTFETQVEVLMPARHVTDPNLIKQHISRIVPGNTTNLFDGLYAGGAQVGSVPLEGYVTRVLLLTDGEPTAGLKDFQSIVRQVADLKARGITVTALGFGPEYNEELMAGIARRAGGNYYYIARPEDIPGVFQKEVEQVLGITAKNARLTLQLPRGATVRQVYGSPPTFGPRTAEIVLGDLEKGTTISKLWEMDWEPRRSGTFRVAKVVLTYDDALKGTSETIIGNAVVEFVADPSVMPTGVDPVVSQELAVVMASRDLEKTMMGMRTQQFSVADVTRAIERTQAFLAQQGRSEAANDLAQAAQALHRGDDSNIEKTLIGTIYQLDQGKRS